MPKISLDQWAAFKAVVDEGSYARAAEALNKSQSAISYAIGRLEEQLPVPLLEQQGRKAELTEAGKIMYRHASNLLAQAQDIEETARFFASGWESEITLAVDALVAMDGVYCGLQRFAERSPKTRIRVLETTLSGTDEALLLRQADIVLTPTVPPGFIGVPVSEAILRLVASPEHQLANLGHPPSEAELKQHRQIVVRDTGIKRTRDSGWLGSEQRWTFSHMSTSIEVVKAGLGFAFLPVQRIQSHLRANTLALIGDEEHQRRLPLYLVVAAPDQAGPGITCLRDILKEELRARKIK